MAPIATSTALGPIHLRTPLIAASGTVGSVWEWATVADVSAYGAAVAKSVSGEPWKGKPAPRLAPTSVGMLNGIGIQNPGIRVWQEDMSPRIGELGVPIWGSAVGESPEEFRIVAEGEEAAGVDAVEVNLSCPNLEDGSIFALQPSLSARVVEAVTASVSLPVGAKLSPASEDVVAVARACVDAGADFLTLTNTIPGLELDVNNHTPKLSGGIGGYSGPGLKPISLRCVYEVASALPTVPIVGCGGVRTGGDVVEELMAGASAVGLGTVHFAEPKAGRRILREMSQLMADLGYDTVGQVVRAAL
ncbi:MAG: dihydroorotate dehydrogenase [Actinobacteria bacterium]|nr:MAG: dihydroorotate dehydrogenase [Actinomycetota bacterium]